MENIKEAIEVAGNIYQFCIGRIHDSWNFDDCDGCVTAMDPSLLGLDVESKKTNWLSFWRFDSEDGVVYVLYDDKKLAKFEDLDEACVFIEEKILINLCTPDEIVDVGMIASTQEDAEYDWVEDRGWIYKIGHDDIDLETNGTDYTGALVVNIAPFYEQEVLIDPSEDFFVDFDSNDRDAFCGVKVKSKK